MSTTSIPARWHPARTEARTHRRSAAVLLAALVTGALVSTVGTAGPAGAAEAPVGLGTVGAYSVLGGQTVTNTGPSTLDRDLGVSPGTAITGFPPGRVGGATHAADAVARQAQSDLTIAYDDAAGRAKTASVAGDLVGRTLTAGVYNSSGPLAVSGTVTLNAQGDPNAVFIFQVASTLITASASNVSMINGAQACHVYWQVGSSATLGTASVFRGTLLALSSISVKTDTVVHGRALARNGAVTLDNNTFTSPGCDTTDARTSSTTTIDDMPTATTGGTVTMTATVTGAATPTGTVVFTRGGTTVGTAPVNSSGHAVLTVPAGSTAGTSTVTATYSGNRTMLPSVSGPVPVTVRAAVVPPTVTPPGLVTPPAEVVAPARATVPRRTAPTTGTPRTSTATGTPTLSTTGSQVTELLAAAAALLALGLTVTWAGRRGAAHRR